MNISPKESQKGEVIINKWTRHKLLTRTYGAAGGTGRARHAGVVVWNGMTRRVSGRTTDTNWTEHMSCSGLPDRRATATLDVTVP